MKRWSLSAVETMYGSLVETLPAVVYVAEPFPPYSTIYISPKIVTLGYTLDDWLSRPDMWVNVIHNEDRDWVLSTTEEVRGQRRENDYEYRLVGNDGSTHWLHDRGKFVLDEMGNPICWQGILLDITEQKKLEAEWELLIGQLQKVLLADVKTLRGLLTICSYCKKVRDDDRNHWEAIEQYLCEHSSAKFSHGVCPECYTDIVLPQFIMWMESKKED